MRKKVALSGVHTHLSARVDHFEVRSAVAINSNLYMPHPINDIEDEPVVQSETWLELHCTLVEPSDRVGQRLELTMGGDDRGRTRATMADIQARDEAGERVYRTYRGAQVRVYDQPKGFALLDAGRPQGSRWS